MAPSQEAPPSPSSASIGNMPQHHRLEGGTAAASSRLEESMTTGWIDFRREEEEQQDCDASVTSSIFSQSFAGSVSRANRGANRRASMRGHSSSLSSVGMSSIAGSGRFGASSSISSADSIRSQGSNPNSGFGGGNSGPSSILTTSSSNSRRRRNGGRGRRLRVKFHPHVQCQVTPPRSDYTPHEKSGTWYSADEGKSMQRDILLTVQTMRSLHSQRVPADRVDLELSAIFGELRTDRGLEHMRTARSIENRRRHKATVSAAVLDEQALQWDEGLESGCIEGEMRIAEASMVVSKVARDDAARKGRRDARFVERMTEEEGQLQQVLNASMNASGGGGGLHKSMDALALGKAAVQSMGVGCGKSSDDDSASKLDNSWTAFDDSSNAFSDLKRTLSSEILESSDNPNEAEDAARSLSKKPITLAREGASRVSMTSGALRRLRLAQLASLSSESQSSSAASSSPATKENRPPRRSSPVSGDARMSLPRKNSLRAQGA